MKPVLVVGAGWSGAVVARELHEEGVPVEVVEKAPVVGGHARVESLNGVVYEPNGAHIFHTSDQSVAAYVQRFGITRTYRHRVLTEVDLGDDGLRLMSWPLQVEELEALPTWPAIRRELADLPAEPSGDDFETYAVSLMGSTLYRLFIENYTRKQWGCAPSTLSSRFAPKRIDLRRDGNRRLFRDEWEFFPAEGVNGAIEAILRPVSVTCCAETRLSDVTGYRGGRWSAVVVTAPLDDFVHRPGVLDWRGVSLLSTYRPTEADETLTPAYVVNRPSRSVPYTRTVETKHATGQRVCGTVVSEEHPGAPARHYPVLDAHGVNESINAGLQDEVRAEVGCPVYFAGRLATYRYIDQDQAIAGAFVCAETVLGAL